MVLESANRSIESVYFPVSGIGSIIALGTNGRRVESGLFGRDGMSGTSVLIGADRSPNDTLMQVPGHGQSIPVDRLNDLMEQNPALRRHLTRYVQALMIQTAHTALSNVHAKLEDRLARWILMCHDRIDGNSLAQTHEFLSIMLGVRRAGVTIGIHILEGKGMIRATRGRIQILDREGLEAEAEQIYGVPEAEYSRFYG
ncbi:helix-turn-helix domain-containing protein [Rhodobacteraceae bacterium 2CG4]|uniref:Helix-turn-helix domain-containing protein n=2 Tax=Halovulum marinum TaxID=2662447 RepID=A0A6L5Z672_9RHOB|nr:helix-turn-helix domain-containing protein [Halovulum marinum]